MQKQKTPYFKNPEIPQATNKAIPAPTKKVTIKLLEPETEPNPEPIAPEIPAIQKTPLSDFI